MSVSLSGVVCCYSFEMLAGLSSTVNRFVLFAVTGGFVESGDMAGKALFRTGSVSVGGADVHGMNFGKGEYGFM